MSFYIKKTFVDTEPGIELVNIHYTWTPLGELPNWEAHRETRMMPRGGVLVRGMGGTTLDDTGHYVQTSSYTVEIADDGVRRKVLRLPREVHSPAVGGMTENFAFHHYFEIFRYGRREYSPLYTEEIVSREIEFVDYQGDLGGMCIFWSIYDWDAPQYQPTEEPNFIAQYGADNPFRSHKFYAAEDKEAFSRIRSDMLKALPHPRRYLGRIYGPRGAQVHQSWHRGNMWQPNPRDRWEDYYGHVVHTL
jgi:hypothetical protein